MYMYRGRERGLGSTFSVRLCDELHEPRLRQQRALGLLRVRYHELLHVVPAPQVLHGHEPAPRCGAQRHSRGRQRQRVNKG